MTTTTPATSRPAPRERLPSTWFAALLGLALALRVGLVVATHNLRLADDPADYQRLAVSVAHGHGFGPTLLARGGGPTAFRPPLYPFLLGVLYRLFGVHVNGARLVQAGLGTLTVALIGLLALRLFGRRVALVATGLAAVYPPLLLGGSSLITESVALPVEVGALLAAVVFHQGDRRWRWPVLAGLLCGLGVLNRENYAVLLAPVALLVWSAVRPRWSRRALAAPLVVVGLAVGVVVPWTVRNVVRVHAFVPVSDLDGFVLSGVYNEQAAADTHTPAAFRPPIFVPSLKPLFEDRRLDEVALSEALRSRAIDYVKAHPAYFPKVVFWNTLGLFDLRGRGFTQVAGASTGYGRRLNDVELVSWYLVALVALAGLPLAWRRVPGVLWLTPVLFVATTVFALGTYRYRAPLEPFVVLCAAVAIARLFERRRA